MKKRLPVLKNEQQEGAVQHLQRASECQSSNAKVTCVYFLCRKLYVKIVIAIVNEAKKKKARNMSAVAA